MGLLFSSQRPSQIIASADDLADLRIDCAIRQGCKVAEWQSSKVATLQLCYSATLHKFAVKIGSTKIIWYACPPRLL